MIRDVKCVALGILIFLLGGCHMFAADKDDAVSRDMRELQQVIKISVPAQAIKWEIFGTPEDKGAGAPGPTDYMTLVAEVTAPDSSWMEHLKDNAGKVWIAPESARPWLSQYFQTLLKTANKNLTNWTHCKKYQVELTKTGKLVDGFACEHEGLLLIHVLLLAPQARDRNPDKPPVFE
ncbi:hypothetical protein [Massilia sp. TWP1-3-3]|uniref:hypothetical protein n=1 Tax=Massilia sp. TWP1-3-3 TaxID=2804573 RepID=UPI003CF42159